MRSNIFLLLCFVHGNPRWRSKPCANACKLKHKTSFHENTHGQNLTQEDQETHWKNNVSKRLKWRGSKWIASENKLQPESDKIEVEWVSMPMSWQRPEPLVVFATSKRVIRLPPLNNPDINVFWNSVKSPTHANHKHMKLKLKLSKQCEIKSSSDRWNTLAPMHNQNNSKQINTSGLNNFQNPCEQSTHQHWILSSSAPDV